MRPDERRAVPDLLLGGLGQAPGERVPRRLARGAAARSSRSAGSAVRRPPRPGRSRRGRAASGPASVASSRRRSATMAPPDVEERGVPEPELVAAGALLADRPEQAVALLERPAVGREVVGVGRRAAGRPAGRAPRGGATGEPTTRSISSGAKSDDPEDARQAGRPARHAVDPDPLRGRPAPVAPRPRTHRRPRPCRGPTDGPRPGRGRVPQRMSSPSALVRCERPQASRTIASSRLVLPAAFGPHDELRTRAERGVERRVAAEVEQRGSSSSTGRRVRAAPGRRVRDGGRQEVVRTGMTTWT